VTHIRNPCHFVVQLNRNIDRLTALTESITTHCKTVPGKNDVPSRVEPGNSRNNNNNNNNNTNNKTICLMPQINQG